MVQIMVVVGAVVGIYAIYQHFTGQDLWRGGVTPRTESLAHTAVGFFGHHLTYGGHVLLLWLCALGWALLGDHTTRRMRALPWACVVLLGLALLWSYARSAQLGAAAGCLVFAFRLPPRRRWIALATVAALAALVMAIPSVGGRFTQLAQLDTESTRMNLWKSSWNAIQAHPWLGCGLGNFGYAMEYFGVEGFYDTKAHSHNDFLMHAVNAGLLGLASALALLVTTVVALWRGCRNMTQGIWLPMAGIACQVGISVGGLFQVFQTDNEVEMVLYFILGAGLAVVNSATPTPRSAPLPDPPDG